MEKRFRSAIVFFFALIYSQVSAGQNWDINTLNNIHGQRDTQLDNFMVGLTNTITYTSVGTPATMYLMGIVHRDSVLQKNAIKNIISLGVSSVITVSLKNIINRPRPQVTYTYLQPLANYTQYSFPSGHTSLAFSNATSISLIGKKWYIVLPAYTYASMIAYSRLHMGVHYPSDVIAGALVGTGSALAAHWLYKKLQGRKKWQVVQNKLIF